MTKIYAGLALLMAFGCGSSDSFSVEGNVAGVGTQNLRVVYRAVPSGDLVTLKATAIDNVFSFIGSAAEIIREIWLFCQVELESLSKVFNFVDMKRCALIALLVLLGLHATDVAAQIVVVKDEYLLCVEKI